MHALHGRTQITIERLKEGKNSLFDFTPHYSRLVRSQVSSRTLPNAGDTPGDFIRRSRPSAKIARCVGRGDCDHRSPRSVYKIADN